MKKTFTFIFILTAALMSAQSFSLYKMNNIWSAASATITNGSTLSGATAANVTSQANLNLVNNSAITVSLSLIRTVVYQNPTMTQDGTTNAPYTNFCFGNTCFPSYVDTTKSADYTILGPASATATPFDNSHQNAQNFYVYLGEAATTGKYFVHYKIFNIVNPTDTLSFTYKYNEFAGINEVSGVIETLTNVYPNPATNLANLNVILKQASPIKIEVFNSLGSLVQSGTEQKLTGLNQLSVDCSKFQSGLYFVTVTSGDTKITRRLVVNK
jgi:hypothetical protein